MGELRFKHPSRTPREVWFVLRGGSVRKKKLYGKEKLNIQDNYLFGVHAIIKKIAVKL